MALTATEKKEIETMVRKEIRDFMGSSTIKQFEEKLMDEIAKDIKRGKLEGSVKEIVMQIRDVINENDVDTIIHLLFSLLDNGKVFEGMSNPPGGDWSGISIIDESLELRWLSLPRVSKEDSKRPDHVFQLFVNETQSIILAVESKEKANRLENNIGKRLINFIRKLLSSPASAERTAKIGIWRKSDRTINLSKLRFASAVAFLIYNKQDMELAKDKTNADIVFGIKLEKENMQANVSILACSDIGKEILPFISILSFTDDIHLSIDVIQ